MLKYIHAHLVPAAQESFSKGQLAWAALADVPGFRGQLGGFTTTGDALVCALWRDPEAYAAFMRDQHDAIAARGAQEEAYTSLDIETFRPVLTMPGVVADLEQAMPAATHLRWADCRVRPDRISAFVTSQQRVWQPGMAGSGMLGGTFWQANGTPGRFLVLTLWPGEEVHARYQRDLLPELREAAHVDRDLEAISGGFLALEPAWTVVP